MSFTWPDGKRAALSLSFDDARLSQVDRGLPILDVHDVKATFYVSPSGAEKRLDDWRAAVRGGHEIGNHTLTHPCSGNFKWSRGNALEDYTLERMTGELDRADEFIEENFGVRPESFAYPCGQSYVGRGKDLKSYVPLIAERYVVGRGGFGETHNAPEVCDLALVAGLDSDGASFEELKGRIDTALEDGGWAVFVSHEVAEGGRQAMIASTLEQVCRYAREREDELWTDTIAAIGYHIRQANAS